MLIGGPSQRLGSHLNGLLRATPPHGSFTSAVAWARQGGVELLADALSGFAGARTVYVGLSNRGTTFEALRLLLDRVDRLFVVYRNQQQTYHPKVYYFAPGPGRSATVLVGSSNLTTGGLDTNLEATWCQELDPAVPYEASGILSVESYFANLESSAASLRVPDLATLLRLYVQGYLSREATLTRGRAKEAAAANARGVVLLPELPPSKRTPRRRLDVPDLPVSTPLDPVITDSITDIFAETLFYVRTQTPTDYRKSLRQMAGTWEWNIGIGALADRPAFWGWPDSYSTLPDGIREWQTTARYTSAAAPGGVTDSLRIWSRPQRPGHAEEFRIRPSSSIRDSVVSNTLGADALVVISRVVAQAHDFEVQFLNPADATYADYSGYLSVARQQHRYGYGAP